MNNKMNWVGTCCRRSVSAFETFETLQGYSDTPTAEQQLSPTNSWSTTQVGTCCRRSVSAFETFETLQGYSDTPTAEQQLCPTIHESSAKLP